MPYQSYNPNQQRVSTNYVVNGHYAEDGTHQLGEMIESSHKKVEAEDKFITSVNYRGQAADRIFGPSQAKYIEVERVENYEPKVESGSPLSKGNNDSNWWSKPSELYSDGSILKNNNIRFGVKPNKRD